MLQKVPLQQALLWQILVLVVALVLPVGSATSKSSKPKVTIFEFALPELQGGFEADFNGTVRFDKTSHCFGLLIDTRVAEKLKEERDTLVQNNYCADEGGMYIFIDGVAHTLLRNSQRREEVSGFTFKHVPESGLDITFSVEGDVVSSVLVPVNYQPYSVWGHNFLFLRKLAVLGVPGKPTLMLSYNGGTRRTPKQLRFRTKTLRLQRRRHETVVAAPQSIHASQEQAEALDADDSGTESASQTSDQSSAMTRLLTFIQTCPQLYTVGGALAVLFLIGVCVVRCILSCCRAKMADIITVQCSVCDSKIECSTNADFNVYVVTDDERGGMYKSFTDVLRAQQEGKHEVIYCPMCDEARLTHGGDFGGKWPQDEAMTRPSETQESSQYLDADHDLGTELVKHSLSAVSTIRDRPV